MTKKETMKKTTKKEKDLSSSLVPVVEIKELGSISFNFEETKKRLASKLEKYSDYEVTEETLSDDKKELANLRKVKEGIETIRKEFKKKMSVPIDEFEDKMKKLSGMVVNSVDMIDEQVKEYDEKRKAEKEEQAKEIIAKSKVSSELPDEYLNRIEFKDSFSNLSTSIKQIEEDVDKQIEELEKEYKTKADNTKVIQSTIDNVNKEIKGKMYAEEYIELLDRDIPLSDILNRIQERKVSILSDEKEEKEEVKEEVVEEKKDEVEEVSSGEKITIKVEITGTKSQLEKFREYMKGSGLDYKQIK